MRQRTPIPDDWNQEDYSLIIACIPDSQKWEAVLLGQFSELERGRNYHEETGSILDAMAIGKEIRDSVMVCKIDDLVIAADRIAVAMESLDAKTPEIVTLGDLIDDLTENPAGAALAPFIPYLEFLIVFRDLLPTVALKADAGPIIARMLDMIWWKGPILGILKKMDTSLAGIALGTLGSGASATLQLLGTGAENAVNLWYQTIKGTGEFFGWWEDLFNWWHGTGGEPEPSNEEKWSEAIIYNDVFITQGANDIDIVNNVDACCDGGSGYLDSGEQAEGNPTPTGMIPPDATIVDRKCKAAHYIWDYFYSMVSGLEVNPPPDWYDVGDTENYLRQLGDVNSFGNLLNSLYRSYSELASALFGGDPQYDVILADLDTIKSDVMCGLVTATTTTEARDAYLDNTSLTVNELEFLEAALFDTVLNVLWWSVEGVESLLENWPTPIDCSECGCQVELVVYGTLDGTLLTSAVQGASENASIQFDAGACGATVTVTNLTLLSGQPANATNQAYRFWDTNGDVLYASNTHPSAVLPLAGVRNFVIVDTVSPYTVMQFTVNYSED